VNWNDEEIRAGIEHCFGDAEDIFLVDVKMNTSRRGHQLIVKCESDSGITIDQLTSINRSIHANLTLPGLDIEQVSVEVTSPGASFPVTTARHFKRLTGHTMKIEHRSDAVQNPLEGEIIAATSDALTVKVEQHELVLSMQDIIQGIVKMRW
jgi:ribosome maturation factor RimP